MARRRLVAIAAAGALAMVGLTGCRVEAGSAAYIGASQYSTADVDQVLKVAREDGFQLADKGTARQAITADMVFLDVAKRYAAEKGYPAPDVDYASVAQQHGYPASDPYLRLQVAAETYAQMLIQHATAVTPTEADYHEVYANLAAQRVQISFAEIEPQLKQIQSIPLALGLRQQLRDAMKRYNVAINPVYGSVAYSLLLLADASGTTYTALTLPLGRTAGDSAVVDAG